MSSVLILYDILVTGIELPAPVVAAINRKIEQYLRWRGVEATLQLSQSTNAKTVIIGNGKDGLPVILGNRDAPAQPTGSRIASVNVADRRATDLGQADGLTALTALRPLLEPHKCSPGCSVRGWRIAPFGGTLPSDFHL
jgi:hypothetical protein